MIIKIDTEEICEKIGRGVFGFFIGGFLGFALAFIIFIPFICFMGMDWTMDFMYSPAHAIIFRVLTSIGGVIGIFVAQESEDV